MTTFWRKWLLGWSWFVALFGAALAAGALPEGSGPNRLLLSVMRGGPVGEVDQTLRFAVALMGCVTLGWGLTLVVLVRVLTGIGETAAPYWRGLTAAVLVWYVSDSLFSIATGFALNALSNTLLLAGYLLPFLAIRAARAERGRPAHPRARA